MKVYIPTVQLCTKSNFVQQLAYLRYDDIREVAYSHTGAKIVNDGVMQFTILITRDQSEDIYPVGLYDLRKAIDTHNNGRTIREFLEDDPTAYERYMNHVREDFNRDPLENFSPIKRKDFPMIDEDILDLVKYSLLGWSKPVSLYDWCLDNEIKNNEPFTVP